MLSLVLAAAGVCIASAASEPKDAACPLTWAASSDIDPDDRIVAYRILAPSGRLCGVVHERERINRFGQLRRWTPPTRWNPYLADSAECWPAPGESVTYCVRAVDATDRASANCSNPYTVVGVPMQCCTAASCAACNEEGR
jgi:hypothetical protein